MNELFSQDNKEDNIKSYRELLVGEGKKFKDDEEVAKGKYFADAAVAVKDKQLDEMRELILQQRKQIDTQESLEELLDQLKQRELANSTNTQAKEVNRETKPMPQDELDKFVTNKVQQLEQEKKAQANLNSTRDRLKEELGDKYEDILQRKMDELGLSKQDIVALASKSPNALFNTLGLNIKQRESFDAPPRSQVRNDSFKPNTEQRTWSWYKTKYKHSDFITNKDINVQMAKDAAELGEAFYDGDFYNKYHQRA